MMFLKGLIPSDRSDGVRDQIYYKSWLTRKVLRLGLPFVLLKKIIGRFKYLFANPPNDIVNELFTDDVQDRQPMEKAEDDVITEGPLRRHSKLREILEQSSEKGSSGHITRMILMKTLKDLACIAY
eukprot:CAMPEP_0168318342 /NCGR_PEP_ID=MMETSP0213-20121227/422_1 /TAXON_ID=151035 /ORGANISM="Euplotes harpa, Strain FSP1.4" /LENGTH=125 /DNA_ID=CAMNT_0008319391 /DNA_START=89 /DNA_END=466 /DNA_ORIENTATION=-